MSRPRRTLKEVLTTKVDRTSSNGCWIWKGTFGGTGYPSYNKITVSRLICAQIHGATGEYLACHRCHNIKCVNPDHIYAGSAKDNTRDAIERGTFRNLLVGRDKWWATKTLEERKQFTSKSRIKATEANKRWWQTQDKETRRLRAHHAATARWDKA